MDGKQEKGRDDRRVRRTKLLLRGALLELLREKSVDQITVTELTGRADVNRGTFYGHYKDVYDMVDQLEEELFQELRELLDAYPADALRFGLRPILEDVFSFISRNQDIITSTLGIRQGEVFLNRLKELVQERVYREWQTLYQFGTPFQRDNSLSFIVGGVVGLIQSWLTGGQGGSPEEMAALAEQLILHGIEPLAQT